MAGKPITRAMVARITKAGGLDAILDRVAISDSLADIATTFEVSRHTLYRWLRKNEERWSLYLEAKEVSADALVEEAGTILDDVDAGDGAPEVSKAKNRADHRRWLATKRDRGQYGDDAAANVQVNVDLGSLHLEALRKVGHMDQLPELEAEDISDQPPGRNASEEETATEEPIA